MSINLPLYEFSRKPKVLFVADVANWSFCIKGHQYKKHLPQYEIDVGYLISPNDDLNWLQMIKKCKYDVIWHQHHKGLDYLTANEFVNNQNKSGTQVICTINEVLSIDDIKSDLKLLSAYNSISVNNPWSYKSFSQSGFNVLNTYDGVNLDVFGNDQPINNRQFKIFFSSSKARLEHKGYHLLQKVKKILKDKEDIQFVEIITDSYDNKRSPEEMNEIYNECKVFICLSVSEGGPCTLLESAACGLVPIMTRVGYAEYFESAIIIDREPEAVVEKILFLKNNPEILKQKSIEISKEILSWSDRIMSQDWGLFLQKSLLKAKGIKLS